MRRLLCYVIFLFGLGFQQVVAEFNTITELVAYTKKLPEFPEDEYVDPYKPHYTQLHHRLEPSLIDSMLSTLGLKPSILYNDIKDRLQKMISTRELHGYYGDFVQKFYIDVETKWYIWGALHGAFHSLVRGLNELKSQGVIDDNLRIVKNRFNFVFNGNTLNYSPYQLETLYVLLRLMEINPEQVFILKGKFEDAQNWRKTNLKQELVARLVDVEDEIPLERELNQLFNTLPLALYLVSTDLDVVRLSFYEKHPLIKEELWGSFLNKKMSESKKIKNILPSREKVNMRAHISSHDVQQFPYKIDSVTYKRVGDIHGWSLFSSPIRLFKEMFSFDEDIAIVLTTGKFFSNWHIELYQQSIMNPKGFIRSRGFNIASGKEVFTANQEEHIQDLRQKIELAQLEQKRLKKACGERQKEVIDISKKDDADIPAKKKEEAGMKAQAPSEMALQDSVLIVGNTTDFSKGSKDWSKLLKKGLELPVEIANRQDGIDGKLIHLVFLDDEYNPELARKNILKLLNDFKTDIVLGAKGTSTLAAYIDLVKEKKILSAFPNTGGFRDPDIPYLLHLRASYDDEGQAVAQYALNVAKKKTRDMRFAFFYQKDDYGKDLLEGAKKVLQKAGYKSFLEVPYETHLADLSDQVKLLKDFDPDIIAFFSLPDQTQKIMRQLGVSYLLDKTLLGNDRLGQHSFRDFLVDRGLVVVIPQIVPNPNTSDLQIAQEFRVHARRYNVPIDTVSFEAYIAAALFIELLRELKEPFTKEGFVKVFESLRDYDFKGLKLTFDPLTRQLLHTVWINVGTDVWVKEEPKLLQEVQAPRKLVRLKVDQEEISQKKPQRIGVQIDMAQQGNLLVIGTMQDLSKSVKDIGIPFKRGLVLPIEDINNLGGVNGLRVHLVTLDDEYNPKITRKLVRTFLDEYKTDVLLGAQGTPTLGSYLDLIREKTILSVFPYAGSYGELSLPYLLKLRASYIDIGYALTKYMIDKKNKRKFALFYQKDHFGDSNLKGAKKALKEAGIEEYLEVPYEAHEPNLSVQATKILTYDPDGIALFSVPFSSEKLLNEFGVSFMIGKSIFANEFHGKRHFRELVEQKGMDLTVAHVMPNPYTSSLAIVQEYRDRVKRAGMPIDEGGLEGYVTASLFIDILKQLELPFTKDALVHFVENMRNYDFKGLQLNFDPKTRQVFKTIWIDIGNKKWIEQK